ncbi:hypothetical protein CDAR_401191 [Caerostris darwini]|uniref:Uncharacterized protein n=1 Tax=Caerostris darwini TaxID=1538125 RepID=A0AAV4V255_9ARAC|nr:hypothetical protein CDAR_401191 [Caerostris darwini]
MITVCMPRGAVVNSLNSQRSIGPLFAAFRAVIHFWHDLDTESNRDESIADELNASETIADKSMQINRLQMNQIQMN